MPRAHWPWQMPSQPGDIPKVQEGTKETTGPESGYRPEVLALQVANAGSNIEALVDVAQPCLTPPH